MTGWRRARTEVAGAWRSLRYDVDRLIADRAAGRDSPRAVMGDGFRRSPRRMLAVAAFSVFAIVGAVGCYVTVVNGLGPLLAQESAETEPYPQVTTTPRRPVPSTHLGAAPAKRATRAKAPVKPAVPAARATAKRAVPARTTRPRIHRAPPHPSTPRTKSTPQTKLTPAPKKSAAAPPTQPAEPTPSASPSPQPSISEPDEPTVRISDGDVGDDTPESPTPLPGWLTPLLSGHPGPFTRPGGGIPHLGGVPVRSKL
jgi:hypothetical protein